ncbi:MAG TPA: Ig-like domain-containing protein [Thermoanaerobaculia bacterium]|nr:Ig-like domain-containing protein [Thermoanaerobaculia bacterium]
MRPRLPLRSPSRDLVLVLLPMMLTLATAPARAAKCDNRDLCAQNDTILIGAARDVFLDVTRNDESDSGRAFEIDQIDRAAGSLPCQSTIGIQDRAEGVIRFSLPAGLVFVGCNFRYRINDGDETDWATVKVKISEPSILGGPKAGDDLIYVDNTGASLGSITSITIPSADLLENDEPLAGVSISQVFQGQKGTLTLGPEGPIYQIVDPTFWQDGDLFDYQISLLADPALTDVAEVRLEPVRVLALPDDLLMPLGVTGYEIPISVLLANDRPAGVVTVIAVPAEGRQLPPFWSLQLSGGAVHINNLHGQPLQGTAGTPFGSFQYQVARTDGVPGVSTATVSLTIGQPQITARLDSLVIAPLLAVAPDCAQPPCPHEYTQVVETNFLFENDSPTTGVEIYQLYFDPALFRSYPPPLPQPLPNGAAFAFRPNHCDYDPQTYFELCDNVNHKSLWLEGRAEVGYWSWLAGGPQHTSSTVLELHALPVPRDDVRTTPVGKPLLISKAPAGAALEPPAESILANDFGARGRLLRAIPIGPEHGTLETLGILDLLYTPNPGFVGQDAFVYETDNGYTPAVAGTRPQATARVWIDVLPLSARGDAIDVAHPVPAVVQIETEALLANDRPAGEVASVGASAVTGGTLAVVDPDPRTGSFAFTPGGSFGVSGVARFEHGIEVAGGDPDVTATAAAFVVAEPEPELALQVDRFNGPSFARWWPEVAGGGAVALAADAAIGGERGVVVSLPAQVGPARVAALRSDSPALESSLEARFLVDVDGLAGQESDTFVLFEADTGTRKAVQVRLRRVAGQWRLLLLAQDDLGGTPKVPANSTVTLGGPGVHVVRVDWWAGRSELPGGMRLWIDGVAVGERSDLVNESQRVRLLRLGAVSELDAGTQGSLTLDSFAAWRNGSVCEWEQRDDFEGAALAPAWSTAVSGGSSLGTEPSAALDGLRGLRAGVSQAAAYAQRALATVSEQVTAIFWLDPNTLSFGTGGIAVWSLRGPESNAPLLAWLRLRSSGGNYELSGVAVLEGGALTEMPWVAITDQPHQLEVRWSGPAVGLGELRLVVDGVEVGALTGLDNNLNGAARLELGALFGAVSSVEGSLPFDELVVCGRIWRGGFGDPPGGGESR